MKKAGYFIAAVYIIILLSPLSAAYSRTLLTDRGDDLQAVINYAADGDTIIISAKTFAAASTGFIDSLCGNCQEHKTPVQASYGFIIKDKSLHLIGADRKKSILQTNAGYGIFVLNSQGSSMENLTVTGGKRDPDGNATDAAIVVRNSKIDLRNLNIANNDHLLDSVVVGIGGIFGREGSEIFVSDCNIVDNGWDGVALYRGAMASISDCTIKNGRGAGIGVTWDASCFACRNIISGYWKGIGAFGTSWVIARNNTVIDNLGWGIIATGRSFMDIANNLVNHNGNCGIAPWSTECRGRIINNIIINNGWKDQWVCPCVGVWNYGDWAKWEFAYNIVWNNKEANYKDIWDQTDINGNLSIDPVFVSDSVFLPAADSPLIDAGHPEISDPDGTRSDIGLTGGPQAGIPKK